MRTREYQLRKVAAKILDHGKKGQGCKGEHNQVPV